MLLNQHKGAILTIGLLWTKLNNRLIKHKGGIIMNPKVLTPEFLESVVGGVDLSDDRNKQLLEVLVIVKKWGFQKRQL